MTPILYLAGLLIGVALFLYIVSLLEAGKEKFKTMMPCNDNNEEDFSSTIPREEDSNGIAFRKRPKLPPGTRICPLCGSTLERWEGLYASKIFDKNNAKILIMGCQYCYKDEESPKVRKMVDL